MKNRAAMTDEEMGERLESIRKALGELGRFRVAYTHKLQNDVMPPDVNILAKASMALEELKAAILPKANPIAANPSDGTRGER